MSDHETLISLSANNNIERLLKKYYSVITEHKDNALWENLWEYLYHHSHMASLKEFYAAIINYSIKDIKKCLLESSICYPIESIIHNITDYYGYNIAIMSDKIIEKAYENYVHMLENDKFVGWDSFLDLLTSSKQTFFSLVNNFPLWKKNLIRFTYTTTNYLIQVFERFNTDFDEIKKLFCTDSLAVKNIFLEQGDRHHDSFVIKFETDYGFLFYKPRSNRIDLFLGNINEILQSKENMILDIKLPDSYGKNDYSWVRGIKYNKLNNRSEEERYYIRIGQLLAIFYILDGNDMHYENVISDGEYPVPIDIETLFSTKLFLNKRGHSTLIGDNAFNYSTTSVKNIGFLPSYINISNKSVDISSLNLDESKTNKKHLHVAGKYSLNLIEIENSIVKGFKTVYWTFVYNMNSIIPIIKEEVAGLKIRYLNHMTAEYATIKDSTLRPICFFNPKYAFAITARIFNPSEEPSEIELYEQKELLNLNIPYFKIRVTDCDLILGNDVEIKNFFKKSPWVLFMEKCKCLGKVDFEYQTTIIKKMFIARKGLALCEINEIILPAKETYDYSTDINTESICKNILDKIINLSNKNPITGEHTWIEYQLSGKNYEVVNVPNNFYSGILGVIKVLVASNIYSKEETFFYVKEVLAILDKVISTDINGMLTGAYEGIGAYISWLRDMSNANIIQYIDYERYLKKLLIKSLKIYKDDKKIDVLDGNAGLILSLLHALEGENTVEIKKQIMNAIEYVTDDIKANICYINNQKYFPVDGRNTIYFNGFAHGSAGIAVALFKAMKVLEDIDYILIESILNTQRLHFNKEEGIWYNDNKHTKVSWGWCHGIPGILLSRLELIAAGYVDSQIEDEVEVLADLSFKKGLGFNTTFCHGDMSVITILELAIKMGYCKHLVEQIREYKDSLIKNVLTKWDLHPVRGTEVVGIMDGLAGIAYFLLCNDKGRLPIEILTITEGGAIGA